MLDPRFNPSLKVDSFFGDIFESDNERFLLFLKAYYEWLQTTKVEYTNLSGTFVRDETIVGSSSGAQASIKQLATGELVVKYIGTKLFDRYETITGETSNATASVSWIKDNVVRATGQLLDNRTIENSVDIYVDYLREELYPSIPSEIVSDRTLLAIKFKDFFESRSNEQSYRFLFRLLYNEDVEFYYPGEDVLRVSDGNFEKTQVIRAAVDGNITTIFDFLEKTIRGKTSGSLATVVDIKIFFIGSVQVAEMTLKLVSGTFVGGEEIEDISDTALTATLYGMITGFNIFDGGSGYEVGNAITITGDGSEAEVIVSSINDSPISALKINTVGHGYRNGVTAAINNSGTGGTGLIVRVTELANTYTVTSGANSYTVGEISKVSIINRGRDYFKAPTITIADSIIASLGLLSPKLINIADAGSDYGVGNTLIFTGGAGANAAGQVASVVETTTYDLLFEDDFRMLSEDSYDDIIKNEDWSVLGPIKRVELTNFGDGYTSTNLPAITVDTTTGSSANLIATNIQGLSANVSVDVANNIAGIGSIRALEIKNFGINYTSANASASAVGDGNANLVPIITALGVKEGNWTNDDGKISYKFLQDSFFYQDFSYVIKSGLAFVDYVDLVKKIIHPAGLQVFGEILLTNMLDLQMTIASRVDVIRDIQTIVVQIVSFFNVGIVDIDTIIRSFNELKFEIDVNVESELKSDEKEYTLFLPYIKSNLEIDASNVEYSPELHLYANTFIESTRSPYSVQIANKSVQEISTKVEYVPTLLTVDNVSFQHVSEYQIETVEVQEIGSLSNIEIQAIVESLSTTTLVPEDETNKYLQINGTISSSSGTQYKDLTISAFANIAISAISSSTFETEIPTINGVGTSFLTDFTVGDVIATRDEYFIVVNIFDDVTLVTDRQPASAINNLDAFKRI
jgi:hypothetical protein